MIFAIKGSLTTMWGITCEGENWKGRILVWSREDSDVVQAARSRGNQNVGGSRGYLTVIPIGFAEICIIVIMMNVLYSLKIREANT